MIQRFQALLNKSLGTQLDDKFKHYFLSGAYKSLLLQIAIAGLTFLTSLLIARLAGEEDAGVCGCTRRCCDGDRGGLTSFETGLKC